MGRKIGKVGWGEKPKEKLTGQDGHLVEKCRKEKRSGKKRKVTRRGKGSERLAVVNKQFRGLKKEG